MSQEFAPRFLDGYRRLARILFGLAAAFSQELEQALQEGRIELGVCFVSSDDPDWRCLACGAEIKRTEEGRDGGRAGRPASAPSLTAG